MSKTPTIVSKIHLKKHLVSYLKLTEDNPMQQFMVS